MYGNQFYRYPIEKRVKYLNDQLRNGHFNSLEELAQIYL
ncbi:hypothetical protein T260_02470 [Geobacillus thermopakistaniensis]|uniref:Uncharacterized protein n=1 Tax=Geobacillus thermopakistaniensis (strain MAS1) TaxID=1408282 RepID=A0A7U9JDJ7_GEOTM|nr:hypothetical protein T260_02470 [Geobacillus sp. MAS1]